MYALFFCPHIFLTRVPPFATFRSPSNRTRPRTGHPSFSPSRDQNLLPPCGFRPSLVRSPDSRRYPCALSFVGHVVSSSGYLLGLFVCSSPLLIFCSFSFPCLFFFRFSEVGFVALCTVGGICCEVISFLLLSFCRQTRYSTNLCIKLVL